MRPLHLPALGADSLEQRPPLRAGDVVACPECGCQHYANAWRDAHDEVVPDVLVIACCGQFQLVGLYAHDLTRTCAA